MYVQLVAVHEPQIPDGEVERTEEVASGVMLDYDSDGRVLGVEILYLDKSGDREDPELSLRASAERSQGGSSQHRRTA